MTIEEKLEQIIQLKTERKNATKELREKLIELERQSDAISESYDTKIWDLMDEIKQEVIKSGSSIDTLYANIEYIPGYSIEPMVNVHWNIILKQSGCTKLMDIKEENINQ
jgi:Tfp pilus assembly protein PilO